MAPGQSGVSKTVSDLFGAAAAGTIGNHYLRTRGKQLFFPLSDTDFEDFTAGWRNVELYLAFLKLKNPGLSISQLLKMRESLISEKGSLLKVPDIMTHDGGRREFYEIKPNNPDGLRDAVDKIASIKAFLDFFGLSAYQGGVLYAPNVKMQLFSGYLPDLLPVAIMQVPVRINVYFHFFAVPPGVILYEICVDAETALEEMLLRAIAAAIILVILFGGEILAGIAAGAEEIFGGVEAGELIPALN
jgi:hypothetical protein